MILFYICFQKKREHHRIKILDIKIKHFHRSINYLFKNLILSDKLILYQNLIRKYLYKVCQTHTKRKLKNYVQNCLISRWTMKNSTAKNNWQTLRCSKKPTWNPSPTTHLKNLIRWPNLLTFFRGHKPNSLISTNKS